MKNGRHDAGLQRAGMILLTTLASHEDYRIAVKRSGASGLVGMALENHMDDNNIAGAVFEFFKAVC